MNNQIPPINVDFFEDLTGDISETPEISVNNIGERIQELREKKGISLEELSMITGFGVERLSKIESNEIQPQLGTIIKLSKALDDAFGRLVSGTGSKLFSITRKDERKPVKRSTSKKDGKQLYQYKSLASDVKGRHMETLIVQLNETSNEELSVHEGEEFIFVLSGTVIIKIGNEEFELEPGDSIYYLSTILHQLSAKTGTATILAVIYSV